MKATILDYTPESHSGRLITESGIEYSFSGYSWTASMPPKAGDLVEITISSIGVVESIYYLNTGSSAQPPLPQDSTFTHSIPNIVSSAVTNTSTLTHSNPEPNSLEFLYIQESNYGFFDWISKGFKNYANFSGRARRKEYWYFQLGTGLVIAFFRAIERISTLPSPGYENTASTFDFLIIIELLLIIPMFAVGARRLHDVGRSGWWQLLELIPLIGWLTLLYFFCSNTSPQNNKWGPPAKPMQ